MVGSFQNTGYNDVFVCIFFLSHFLSWEMPLSGMEGGMDSSFVSFDVIDCVIERFSETCSARRATPAKAMTTISWPT